jgi:hypothetical protein
MNSPTSRSLAKLRKEGWTVAVVERWNQYAKVRQDLFGFIDLIAIKGDITLAVQSTSGANVSARIAKIQACQAASVWLESPMRKIVVHGWRKVGPRGARKLWECREVPLTKPFVEVDFVRLPLPAGTPEIVQEALPL